MRLRNLALSTIVIALAGCGIFGPNYSKPNITTQSNWNSKDTLAQTTDANLPATAWWKNMHDTQLNNLIESALANNNDIQIAVGNIISAQGVLEQINYGFIPTLNVSAGFDNQAIGSQPSGVFLAGAPNYNLNIAQQIRLHQYAKANLATMKAAKDAVRLSIISQVTNAYFILLNQKYQLGIQENLVTDLTKLLELTKAQYKYGLVSLYTLQQYEQQYDKAQAGLPIIQSNIVDAQNTLRYLLNQNPGKLDTETAFLDLPSDGIIPTNTPSTVLRNRPDVQQAEQQLIAANANIGVATTNFFPSISITNDAGLASGQLTSLFTSGATSGFWNVTAQAAMPILSMSTFGQIKQAKGQFYAAYYNYIKTVRGAFKSVADDLAAHQAYTSSLNTQVQYVASNKKAYDLSVSSYEKGLYSYPTVLQNKVNYENSQIVLAQSKLNQLNTIVKLYQDMGGGYSINNESENFTPEINKNQ